MKKIIAILMVLAMMPVAFAVDEGITNDVSEDLEEIDFEDLEDFDEAIGIEDSAVEEISTEDPGILPDSRFYGLKRLSERISLAFSFSEESRQEKQVEYAERRIVEAQAMVSEGKTEYVPELMEDYEVSISSVVSEEGYSETVEVHREALDDLAVVVNANGEIVTAIDDARRAIGDPSGEAIPGEAIPMPVPSDDTPSSGGGNVVDNVPEVDSVETGTSSSTDENS